MQFNVISYIIGHICLIISEIMNKYQKILDSWKSVFTKKDLEKILDLKSKDALDKFLYRSKKTWILKNIFYGIYVLKNYNVLELACKIKKKSYISLETVLKEKGVIFQYYEKLFLISDNSLEKNVDDKTFCYKKIKDEILLNQLWLIHKKNYIIASLERAICDRIYLTKNYYFDNCDQVNFEKLEEISKIYKNNRVILEVKKLKEKYAR